MKDQCGTGSGSQKNEKDCTLVHHSHSNVCRPSLENSVERHCRRLNLAQNVVLCAILPVWRTTPITILQSEAEIPPIHHMLDYLRLFVSLRLHQLQPKHPLRLQSNDKTQGKSPTCFERVAKLYKPKVVILIREQLHSRKKLTC